MVKKLNDVGFALPDNPNFGFIKFWFAQKFHSNSPVNIFCNNDVF